jgi:hypothetical protein
MATRSRPNWKVLDRLLPIFEKEGWSHAQIAEDWGMSLATLEEHLTQEVPMSAASKHDYPALFEEYDQRLAGGESPKAIRATFEGRGVNWGTFQNRRSQWNKAHRSTPKERQDTPEAHQSTPEEPDLSMVHSGTPEHLSTPESTEISPDEQYTEEHLSTLQDVDPTEVHHGTLEGHQEVMEDISESVPDAPHIATEETYQSTPEHLSTPEVHQKLSVSDSSTVHPGVLARQEHDISTFMVHQGTPTSEDWEVWTTIKERWKEVEKMLADRQTLLSTPSTPGNTQKKTYVFDVRHISLIEAYAQEHRLELKDVIYAAFEQFFQRR